MPFTPPRAAALAALAVLLAGPAPAADPAWRDLNHNGRLDPYEDARQPVERRIDDLLGQMTLAEKVGTMLHGTLPAQGDAIGHSAAGYDLAKAVPPSVTGM